MSVVLLVLFTFCSCGALAMPAYWYFPAASYVIWAFKHSTEAVQHLYMYRTCAVFFTAFGFRAAYHPNDQNFKAFVIYAVVYAILFYVSFKHVRSVETYKSSDEEDDPHAES